MRSFKIYIALLLIGLFGLSSMAQTKTRLGYRIDGNWLVFVFNVEDYSNITDYNIPVRQVYVAGEFNHWSPDSWLMEKMDNGNYELRKPLSDFTGDYDWEFKFVVNGRHWAEPTDEFENKVQAKNDFGMNLHTYNLRLYSAFASKYGNVTFKLKGFKDAEEVLVTGSFNRWDESSFSMTPTEDGWAITLQLRPDRYEYKFIIDGEWMTDPANPEQNRNEYHGFNSVINVTKWVEFKLWGHADAEDVFLAGDFNDWDPNSLQMKRKEGYWVTKIELSGGKHHYKFIVDGAWMTDPYNSVAEYDENGNINSVCMVK